MTKKELSRRFSAKRRRTFGESKKDIDAVLEIITEALANGEKVTLNGFGTFEVRDRKEKLCPNPATNEMMTIPAYRTPKFTAGRLLKSAVIKR